MFDIGWSELLIIGVVALIVIGPKDLPEMFRTLGRFTAKARSMSRDFQRAMESAAKESGVADAARDMKNVVSSKNLGLDAVRDAATRFEKWDPLKPGVKSAPVSATADSAVPAAGSGALGPATAALADAKAKERAAILAAAEKRSVDGPALPVSSVSVPVAEVAAPAGPPKTGQPVLSAPASATAERGRKRKDLVESEPVLDVKPRKSRKSTTKGKGDA